MAMKFHSFVRLVTNSSSETYMFVNKDQFGVDKLKSFINAVLSVGGSSVRCDDLFDIELVPIRSYLDEIIESSENDEDLDEHWMAKDYPNGIHSLTITPKEGVVIPVDLGNLILAVFDVQEIGNEW